MMMMMMLMILLLMMMMMTVTGILSNNQWSLYIYICTYSLIFIYIYMEKSSTGPIVAIE